MCQPITYLLDSWIYRYLYLPKLYLHFFYKATTLAWVIGFKTFKLELFREKKNFAIELQEALALFTHYISLSIS